MAIAAKAKALRAQGRDVLNLSAGEPDFDTPEHIKAAAAEAMRAGHTKYTPAAGIPELKSAVCQSLKRSQGLEYQPQQAVISCGAKYAISIALSALVQEGDEVLVLAPFWVSYPVMARLAGATPRILYADGKHEIWNPDLTYLTPPETGFKISPAALAAGMNEKTKVVIINAPSNPTGAVYSPAEQRELAKVLARFPRAWVISDEIYDVLTYEGESKSIVASAPELKDRTIIINGVSKTYSMTGWRIGWALGPEPVINAMGSLQSQTTGNPTSISQYAALAALNGPQDCVARMFEEFKKRSALISQELRKIPDVKCPAPKGAFYAFPDCRGLESDKTLKAKLLSGKNQGRGFSAALTDHLLDNALVAVVPGAEFGLENHLRLSFAASSETITKAVTRIAEAVAALKRE